MEGDQFSLCWSSFSENLSSGLHTLMQDKNMVDVTIATAQGQQLKAHKIVLAVASPYFKDIFAANPCKHPIIILPHVEYSIIQSLIHFMYVGEVHVAQEDIAKFMNLAEFLKVKGLTDNANEFESNGVDTGGMGPSMAKRPRTIRKMLRPAHYPPITPKEEPTSPTPTPIPVVPIYSRNMQSRPMSAPGPSPGPSRPTSRPQTIVNPAGIPANPDPNLAGVQRVAFVPLPAVLPKTENNSFIQPKREPIDHDEENTSNSGGELDISQVVDPQLMNERPLSNVATRIWPSTIIGAPSNSPGTLQCILGRRGNPRLIVDGHVFYKKSVYKGKAFWYCKSSRTPEKCPSVCWTMNGNIVKWPGVHSHPVIPDVFNPEEDTEVPIENLQEVLWQTSF